MQNIYYFFVHNSTQTAWNLDAMALSNLLQMPLHLIAKVLVELECMRSVGSAILSHPIMYAAFKEYPKTVIYRILLKQVPRELIAYAVLAYNTSWRGYRGPQEMRRLIHSALRCVEGMSNDEIDLWLWGAMERMGFNPATVSSLSKIHTLVEHFTRRYLKDTLPIASRDLFRRQSPTNARRPSETEVFRIRRGFYRFQIYCNLVRMANNDTEHSLLARQFFLRWSPWVNEQLACIHDHLEGVLSEGAQLTTRERNFSLTGPLLTH